MTLLENLLKQEEIRKLQESFADESEKLGADMRLRARGREVVGQAMAEIGRHQWWVSDPECQLDQPDRSLDMFSF